LLLDLVCIVDDSFVSQIPSSGYLICDIREGGHTTYISPPRQ